MPATACCATSCAQSPWTEPDDLELRELLHALVDAGADLVVDEDPGEAADLEEVAALGQLPGEVLDLPCPSA